MHAVLVRGAEHHQCGIPKPVQRILRHLLLSSRAVGHLHHDVETLALVERLFLANAYHRSAVRSVRGPLQRHLVHDRRPVDQPAHRPHVGPSQSRVVEDGGVFHPAVIQPFDQFVPAHAQRLGRAVKIKSVTGLVLNLGQQNRFPLKRRGSGDPIAFRQLTYNFRMSMLADLPDQRFAVTFRHPILRFDFFTRVDARLKRGELLRRFFGRFGFNHLRIHPISLRQTLSIIIAVP